MTPAQFHEWLAYVQVMEADAGGDGDMEDVTKALHDETTPDAMDVTEADTAAGATGAPAFDPTIMDSL